MQMQTSLDIESIGRRLKAARLSRGESLSEVGRITKILPKFLEAMESDDFSVLSAPVYAKSFLRMYARHLELDDRELVEKYVLLHATQNAPALENVLPIERSEEPVPTIGSDERILPSAGPNDSKRLWVLGTAVLAAFLLLALFAATRCSGNGRGVPVSEAPSPAAVRIPLADQPPELYLDEHGIPEALPPAKETAPTP